MANKGKKHLKRRKKNALPIFDSDHDLLKAFEKQYSKKECQDDHLVTDNSQKVQINKHGVQVLDNLSESRGVISDEGEEDFVELLEESFKKKKLKPTQKPSPMPVKKRLKRYPPVEVELDLHGYNAIGAQVKARSFIQSCKHQGYFTLRIIVGKGLHSDLGPVLPDVVEDVLKELKKQKLIIFYEWDRKKKSKSGAVIVYLKQFDEFD
ncbi:MAG: Smr/MutS family protein [Desulfobacteraceae bacterium]|nr:Smr/MutS family protein [Desulfobacteraceae bacterium]